MAQPHSARDPQEVSAATNGLCTGRFWSRCENSGLLPASSNCSPFSSQLHRERLGGGPVQNSPQSGGLDAQCLKRSLCPCFTLPRGEYKGPHLLWLGPLLHLGVGPTNRTVTFTSVLNTMVVVFCKEVPPVSISDTGS